MVDKVLTRTLSVAGLPVHIYSHAESKPTVPVAVIFVLHGRKEAALEEGHLERVKRLVEFSHREENTVEHLFVSFDLRNHGARLNEPLANNAWGGKEPNARHAIDMYATQIGTMKDVSFLIDFLPFYLYPNDERDIATWGVVGMSLGGHSAWLALAHEPRLAIGVPIIASPDYLKLMGQRAEKSGISMEAPHFPDALKGLVERDDPCRFLDPDRQVEGENPFVYQNILVLSGADDTLVPWSASEEFVDSLESRVKRVKVYESVGHECTVEMLKEAADFIIEQSYDGM